MAYVNPYPRSLQQPFRPGALVVGAGMRAYFAPFNAALAATSSSTSNGPFIIDLTAGPFTHSALVTAGFADLGWIKDFKATVDTKIGQVRSGKSGVIRKQYKGQVGESCELKFREYGRMQYKIGNGTNVVNLLPGGTASLIGPVSASGAPYASMVSYSSVTPSLTVDSATGFAAGDMVVADVDYDTSSYGVIGDAGMPIYRNAVTDVDYIRKTSDYVARVVSISGNVLTLDQAFIGGGNAATGTPNYGPAAGSKVQKVIGFAARQGGAYISEWTGVFLCDTDDVAQVLIYYPHISIVQNRDSMAQWQIENIGTTDLTGYEIDAQFQSLAFDDPLDGEPVCGYRCYYPPPSAGLGY